MTVFLVVRLFVSRVLSQNDHLSSYTIACIVQRFVGLLTVPSLLSRA